MSLESLNKFNIKKYILKANEIYKKNIMIYDIDIKTSIELLSDLLHNLSLMTNVNKIYNNSINILTSNDNKKYFKKMLLDNPYLYFTDFNIKTGLSKLQEKELTKNDSRNIYIIDLDNVEKIKETLKILSDRNVHIFGVTSSKTMCVEMFSKFGETSLLIHKNDRLKQSQKIYYRNVIRQLTDKYNEISFDDYYKSISNEKLRLRYIILKNKELRYY